MKKFGKLALVLSMVFLLFGCGTTEKRTENEQGYQMYKINAEDMTLTSVDFHEESNQTHELVQKMREELVFISQSGDENSLLPSNVTLLSANLNGQYLSLNLSEGYNEIDKVQEILIRAGLVKSFEQFPGVSAVMILVEGVPLRNSTGAAVGYLTADSFVDTEGKEIDNYEQYTCTLYFPAADGDYLLSEVRSIRYSSTVPTERRIVDTILKGPENPGMRPSLPSSLRVLGVTMSDDIVYVNLDETFLTETPGLNTQLMLYSLVNSLVENTEATRVQISVNGETKDPLPDGTDLNQFFRKNTTLLEGGADG